MTKRQKKVNDDAAVAERRKAEEKADVERPFPESPQGDPTVHAVPASTLAAAIDGSETSGAAVNAQSIDAANAQMETKAAEEKAEEDNSLVGRINRSGLFFIRDHVLDQEYVGVSPQCDADAHPSSKSKSVVTPLTLKAPQTGMLVRPKGGLPFVVPDGFGQDSSPEDWGAITNPHTGESLF